MRCTICKKTSEELTIYEGLLATEMIHICEECAEDQKVPIIKKPSQSQLSKADKTYSVRERLDKMSGRRDTTDISREQTTTQRNLAKLRAPPKKQYHEDVLDDYPWTLKMTRRRIKMTVGQLANKISASHQEIQNIEKGVLPENFKEIFLKIEALLGIKLLKAQKPQVNFTRRNRDKEQEILKAVEEKMKNPEKELEKLEEIKEVQEKIEREEIKLSKRKDIKDVTINDLVDRKRAREKYKLKSKQSEMIGDDLDIEEL
jgi:ribosome-binding protein aMBF1 (putative translation factor)